jgi:hypothetical protein
MLTNFELEDIANHYGLNLNAIVMKDELKNYQPRNGNYIINLQSSSQGNGSHWIALFVQDKNCFYCDSFGVICPTEITAFCKRIPKSRLGFSEKQIQFIESETCGFYALGLLIHINQSKNKDIYKSASDFINIFSYDTKYNNTILKKYFRALPESKSLKLLSKLYSQK